MPEPSASPGRHPDRLSSDVVGRRVSVRFLAGGVGPSGAPAMRDVVGTLERVDQDGLTVRRRDGTTEQVDHGQVVLTKVVPGTTRRLRRATEVGVAELELVAADGWRALEQSRLGDWVLRASEGFTGRANSVLPVGDSGLALDAAIEEIRAWYDTRSLPAQFQVSTPYAKALRDDLLQRGWTVLPLVSVLVADIERVRMSLAGTAQPPQVRLSATPDAAWLTAFKYRGEVLPPVAERLLVNADHALFASATVDETGSRRTVGIGRAAVTGAWAGITCLEVDGQFRRSGVATAIIAEITEGLRRLDVRHVYVQVVDDNVAALTLYERLGFVQHHRYSYLRLDRR